MKFKFAVLTILCLVNRIPKNRKLKKKTGKIGEKNNEFSIHIILDYKNYHKNLNYYTNKTSNGNILTQVCTNINRCFCDFGFTGPDCSIPVPSTTAAPTLSAPTSDNTIKMEKKETPYGKLDLCPIHYNLPNKNNNFLICAVFYLQFSFDFFSYITGILFQYIS